MGESCEKVNVPNRVRVYIDGFNLYHAIDDLGSPSLSGSICGVSPSPFFVTAKSLTQYTFSLPSSCGAGKSARGTTHTSARFNEKLRKLVKQKQDDKKPPEE
jgi:hypothetical protein